MESELRFFKASLGIFTTKQRFNNADVAVIRGQLQVALCFNRLSQKSFIEVLSVCDSSCDELGVFQMAGEAS
jgi:hypothetical protein